MQRYEYLADKEYGKRTAERLVALRGKLSRELPDRSISKTLLLATWNIRDFDSNKFRHGPRLPESYYYIAEVLSAFDLVALQEVNEDLAALRRVMRYLGTRYDYIATDTTEGTSGNKERMAFVYDKRKVTFENIAGEIVLPDTLLVQDEKQFARTPFQVTFQGGWFVFDLCTVHIYYGADSGEKLARRIDEIDGLAKFMAKRAKKKGSNVILLGDFNIVSPEHKTMEALANHGFTSPEVRLPTNVKKDKHYDQIAFMVKPGELRPDHQAVEKAEGGSSDQTWSGVFDVFRSVFAPKHLDDYYDVVRAAYKETTGDSYATRAEIEKYYLGTWRTFQISDHLPLWVSLKVDFSDSYLEKLKGAV